MGIIAIFVFFVTFYPLLCIFPGWLVGMAGESVFDIPLITGMFLWPLVLCGLLFYGIMLITKLFFLTFQKVWRE
jgi:hypothetical protein